MRQSRNIWSQKMSEPEFRSNRELMEVIKTLQPAEKCEVFTPEGKSIEQWRAIRGKQDGNVYGMVSPRYQLIQDFEVAVPVLDAFEEAGIEAVGTTDQRECGRFYMDVNFGMSPSDIREQFTAEIRAGDSITFGLEVFNGKNGEMGWGAHGMAVRQVCTNGLIGTTFFKGFQTTHMKNKAQGVMAFAKAIERLMGQIPAYVKAAKASVEAHVEDKLVVELLMGAGMSQRMAEDVYAEIDTLVPDMTGPVYNGWRLHNAVTAKRSHEEMTDSLSNQLSTVAARLLVVDDYSDMIDLGKEKIKIKAGA